MMTGSIVDYAIKLFLGEKHYIEEIAENHVRRQLERALESSFEKAWQKMSYRIWKHIDDTRASCLKRLDNFFGWLWERIKTFYAEYGDWNTAFVMAKPKPGKRLYCKELGIIGVPDGFLYDDGELIPLDYKSGSLTPEIRLQMTFYAILTGKWTGKVPKTAKVLCLGSDNPEKTIKLPNWRIEYAKELIKHFKRKTQSTDEKDYPRMSDYKTEVVNSAVI